MVAKGNSVDRLLYSLSAGDVDHAPYERTHLDTQSFRSYVSSNIIGQGRHVSGPFGVNAVLYCDYMASGKSVRFIEDYIRDEVLPSYSNTHSTMTNSALQTTSFRDESRILLRSMVGASAEDAVIMCGDGCTAAVHKLLALLDVAGDRNSFVLLTSAYEHHSSLLPFTELARTVEFAAVDGQGRIDLSALENQLSALVSDHQGESPSVIGVLCAASNVTGIVVDTVAITALFHRYRVPVFWDYAAAAPYVKIEMNPVVKGIDLSLTAKDAIFFSMHKFIGGVQTPGILVVKKRLVKNRVPHSGGGGTVFFVRRENHLYLKDIETREEGGTPAAVGCIRAGLTAQLKLALTAEAIVQCTRRVCSRFLAAVSCLSRVSLLGPAYTESEYRLPVFSLLISTPGGGYLHHNFVSALLNDLFGIETRAGCMCAGPYAQFLLGINEELSARFEQILQQKVVFDARYMAADEEYSSYELLRPGFTRLTLSPLLSDEELDFICEALRLVADSGWSLLPQYVVNPNTGEWRHFSNRTLKERRWLGDVSYRSGKMTYNRRLYARHEDFRPISLPGSEPATHTHCLQRARNVFSTAVKECPVRLVSLGEMFSGEATALRWFLLPDEAQILLFQSPSERAVLVHSPFTPRQEVQHETCNGGLPAPVPVCQSTCKCSDVYGSRTVVPDSSSPVGDSTASNETVDQIIPQLENTELFCDTLTSKSSVHTKNDEIDTNSIPNESLLTVKWQIPPRHLYKKTAQAILEFDMLRSGDRVLVCLSGGKDSLSLLHVLHQYQFAAASAGRPFHLAAATVDPLSSAYDPRPLQPYLRQLGVTHFLEAQDIMNQAKSVECSSICSFCSRMKRGRLYAVARRHGYNVLAFGQHLDDIAESFLMSVFHNGRLRTMKACYTVARTDLRVVRPMIYVREQELRCFARDNCLPVIPENCPGCFEEPKERRRVKQLLSQQQALYPRLMESLRTALRPLYSIAHTGVETTLFGKSTVITDADHPDEDDD